MTIITDRVTLIFLVIGILMLVLVTITSGLYIGYGVGTKEIPVCLELPAHILRSTSVVNGSIHCHYEVIRNVQRKKL